MVVSEQPSCATPSFTLSPSVAEWKLRPPQDCLQPVPAELRTWGGTTHARRACRAEYDGSPQMTLTIYYMPGWSGATAFDAFQRWKIQPGKMAFYKSHYFGVVESPLADRKALDRFTLAVEEKLPGRSEFHW